MWRFNRNQAGDNYAAFPIPYASVAANGGNGAGYWTYLGDAWAGTTRPPDVEGSEAFWDAQNNEVVGIFKIPADLTNFARSAWAINPTTGAVTVLNAVPSTGENPVLQWASCTHSTTPKLGVYGNHNTTEIYVWNLSTRNTVRPVRRTTSGSSAYNGASGWYPVWHAASNAFFMFNQSGSRNIVKLAMNTPADPFNSTWTYSTVTISSGPTPPNAGIEMWSKFNIIKDMGNGQSCLLSTSYSQGVWALKIPFIGM